MDFARKMSMAALLVALMVAPIICALSTGAADLHDPTTSSRSDLSTYSVNVTRLNHATPVIDSQVPRSSVFTYNYNSAVVPFPNQPLGSLLIRTQNLTAPWGPYNIASSRLAIARPLSNNLDSLRFSPVTSDSIVFEGEGPEENFGTEDPRIVYREMTKEYILLYTAVRQFPNGTFSAKLAMATTKTPLIKSSWIRHGPVFPDIPWSKSGALLLRDDVGGPHYLIFGDSSLLPGIQMAISDDLKTWKIMPDLFLKVRPGLWDSALVEAGPMPLRLSDGNYLFLYNSAQGGFPSKKPGYQFQYNLGWIVLDSHDPTKILARSEAPILTPTLDWELGSNPSGLALVPNVVFCEGWQRKPSSGQNTFLIYYGGADSVMGVAEVRVTLS